MLKKIIFTGVLCLLLILLINNLTMAANVLKGNFFIENNKKIKFTNRELAPFTDVAKILDYNHNWELDKGEIRGHLRSNYFKTDDFVIAYGDLFLPVEFYENKFGIEIVIRGNNYFIYVSEKFNKSERYDQFELVINLNKKNYDRYEPIAVTVLLLNKSNEKQLLKFSSGQKYDIVMERYGREIWRLSEGRGYLQSISVSELDAHDYLLYTNLIKPGSDRYLAEAEYTLFAEINTTEGSIISNQVEIDIN